MSLCGNVTTGQNCLQRQPFTLSSSCASTSSCYIKSKLQRIEREQETLISVTNDSVQRQSRIPDSGAEFDATHPTCEIYSTNYAKSTNNNIKGSEHAYPGILGASNALKSFASIKHPPLLSKCLDIKNRKVYPSIYSQNVKFSNNFISHLSCLNNINVTNRRLYQTSRAHYDSRPSSQVEVTVNALKEKAEASKQEKEDSVKTTSGVESVVSEKTQVSTTTVTSSALESKPATVPAARVTEEKKVIAKRSLWTRVKEEIVHYYHGFRLLFIDTRICIKYCYRILNGDKLSRREHRQVISRHIAKGGITRCNTFQTILPLCTYIVS